MAEGYISIGEALKLIPPFKGNKSEVPAFIGNVDTAFSVINPNQKDMLYKFVLTRISGEPRTAIIHRHLEDWFELKEFLQNSYIEKRTLDFHASQLFRSRQGKDERVSEWIQRLQTLGSKFRESALLNSTEGAREGILDLSDRLRNICFVQGLHSDRIQTIVRSRNYRDFDEIAETALVEESAIVSRQDRYRNEGTSPNRCSSCGKIGHTNNKCYSKVRREARVNPVVERKPDNIKNFTCFRCGERGHVARYCRSPQREREGPTLAKRSGNERRPTENSRPAVASTQ
jgi:hypothetical protein